MIQRMEDLIKKLNVATLAYDKGSPIMSDKKYDDMWFELKTLEEQTGIVLPDSPTQSISYEVVSELKKVEHNHPMLSLDKTKDIKVIESFLKGHDWIAMAKMDGLTCSLKYLDGKLVSAETRGNGIVGEDITHNANVIPSIPKTIPYKEEVIIDGEIICTYKDFEKFENDYKNPRNFASGSIRLLDSKECSKRHLTFIAWDVVKGGRYEYLSNNLTMIASWNFKVVPILINDPKDGDILESYINTIKRISKEFSYPIDGVVFKYDTIEEYNTAGRTDHHFKGGLAYKFYDEAVTSYLRDIEWTMGRTGILTPVAIYDKVEIEGSICNRASLHNISIMKQTLGEQPYFGQCVEVAKVNQIIPQIVAAQDPKMDMSFKMFHIPNICPYCGGKTQIKKDNDSEILFCTNPQCDAKLINRLDHFSGKKGLDIKGLSKMTLEKLINWGWIESISDLFKLHTYRTEWIKKPGFGVTSVDKILQGINLARNCSFENYLCALGIPLIGKVASKDLAKTFKSYKVFRTAIDNKDEKLYQIPGIGEVMIDNLLNFCYNEADEIFKKYLIEVAAAPSANGNDLATISSPLEKKILNNKNFVITGRLQLIQNREKLKSIIEQKGGKVTESISSKTDYLVCNDKNSTSSKMKKAKSLNIQIISEQECLDLCNE